MTIQITGDTVTYNDGDGPITLTTDDYQSRLKRLAEPFDPNQIELKPQQLKREDHNRFQCKRGTQASADGVYCGGYHARSVHLDYVGHAGITMRLGEVDPYWRWDAVPDPGARGLVVPPGSVGMWMRLTVLGVSRYGFGDGGRSQGGNWFKECIGDGIRNAAMRFGVATYLWSKSEAAQAIRDRGVEGDDPDPEPRQQPRQTRQRAPQPEQRGTVTRAAGHPEDDAWNSPAPDTQDWVMRILAAVGKHPVGPERDAELKAVYADITKADATARLVVIPRPWRDAVPDLQGRDHGTLNVLVSAARQAPQPTTEQETEK